MRKRMTKMIHGNGFEKNVAELGKQQLLWGVGRY